MRQVTDEGTARRHAARIERHWRDQGYLVKAWVERVEGSPKGRNGGYASFWAVRSDIVNGHPTRRIPE